MMHDTLPEIIPEDSSELQTKINILQNEFEELKSKLEKDRVQMYEKEINMIENNIHPCIKNQLSTLEKHQSHKMEVSAGRRDIEIDRICKEFEAQKRIIEEETEAIEKELILSLQRDLYMQLEKAMQEEEDEKRPQINDELESVSEITMKSEPS